MYIASKVLMNTLVHIIIINVFTSLWYANLVITLVLKKTLRHRNGWNRPRTVQCDRNLIARERAH